MEPQHSASRTFSHGGTFFPEYTRGRPTALAPEQWDSIPVHVDPEEFIDDLEIELTAHDCRALENAKRKPVEKHYKSHHIQQWNGNDYEHRWGKLEIAPSIGCDLADNVGGFGRRKKPARASTRVHRPTVSTSRVPRPVVDSVENEG